MDTAPLSEGKFAVSRSCVLCNLEFRFGLGALGGKVWVSMEVGKKWLQLWDKCNCGLGRPKPAGVVVGRVRETCRGRGAGAVGRPEWMSAPVRPVQGSLEHTHPCTCSLSSPYAPVELKSRKIRRHSHVIVEVERRYS
jgi:hypothetical protein